MLQQHCRNCGGQFDYYSKVATIICNQNHVVCKICSENLKRVTGRCPYCNGTLLGANPYGASENQWQPPSNNNIGSNNNQGGNWQPNQGIANNAQYRPPYQYQPIPNNQGFAPAYPQPNNPVYNPVPVGQQSKNSIKFAVLAFFFFIVFIALVVLRTQMDRCEYWHFNTCYSYLGNQVCCSSYDYDPCPTYGYCYDIHDLQNIGSVNGATVGCAIAGFIFLIMLISFCNARKRQRRFNRMNMGLADGVYVRA